MTSLDSKKKKKMYGWDSVRLPVCSMRKDSVYFITHLHRFLDLNGLFSAFHSAKHHGLLSRLHSTSVWVQFISPWESWVQFTHRSFQSELTHRADGKCSKECSVPLADVCAADVYLCGLSTNWMKPHSAGESLVFADLMNPGGFPTVMWHTYYQLNLGGGLLPRPVRVWVQFNIRLYFTCTLLKFTHPSLKLSPCSFLSKRTHRWIMPPKGLWNLIYKILVKVAIILENYISIWFLSLYGITSFCQLF